MLKMKDYEAIVEAELQNMQPECLDMIRSRCMLRPLTERLLIDHALGSTEVTQKQINQAMSTFLQQQKISNQSELDRHCKLNGIKESELANQVSLPVRIATFSLKEFGPKSEAYFLKRKESLDQVRYSLIRVEDQGLAHELYFQIDACEADFDQLATEHSKGPEQQTNGQIGWSSLSRAHPLLRDRLSTATPGITLEPFQIEQWWVIARLDERRPAIFDPVMHQQMATELFHKWIEQATNNLMNRLSEGLMEASVSS